LASQATSEYAETGQANKQHIKRLMWNGLCSFMSQSCSMMMWGSSWINVRLHLHGSFGCGCWKSAKCFSQCSLATIVWCKTNHSKNGNADFQCEIITQETPNSTNKISHTFERSRKTVGLLRSNTSHV
jgi:hypothetical protein